MTHTPLQAPAQFPIFLSVVLISQNRAEVLVPLLERLSAQLMPLTRDHEIIVVDNASTDDSLETYARLTGKGGLPNLQIYALTKEVEEDTAYWVGLERALGDITVVLDPTVDDIGFIPAMLEKSMAGAAVVFARNLIKPPASVFYTLFSACFSRIYKRLNNVNLREDAPSYRAISKKVVNFIMMHPQPALAYRHLPATAGFRKAHLTYSAQPQGAEKRLLRNSIDRGMRLVFSTTQAPMRLVTLLCLSGAMANLAYSGYIIGVWMFKRDIAAGWTTLSLQQSGMFFLITLVLMVLAEYILNMVRLTNEGPLYHLAQEFTSEVVTSQIKLNIEEGRQAATVVDIKRTKTAA